MKETPHKRKAQGRPPLPRDQARSERVVTFLTPCELRSLEELAERTNQSLSATCHALIVHAMSANPPKWES